jgi:hypothetical protein
LGLAGHGAFSERMGSDFPELQMQSNVHRRQKFRSFGLSGTSWLLNRGSCPTAKNRWTRKG